MRPNGWPHATTEELESACTQGVGYACFVRGDRIMDFWDSLPPDPENDLIHDTLIQATHDAQPWFERACPRGIQEACFREALALQTGGGVTKDPERAARLLTEACRDLRAHGSPVVSSFLSCEWLGEAYEKGLGVPLDHQRGHELLHEACLVDYVGCDEMYLIRDQPKLRWFVWILEAIGALAPNLFAAFAPLRRRPTQWLSCAPLCMSVIAGLSIAGEFWFYLIGSRLASVGWWALAPLPALFPLWAQLKNRREPN
jgi:hypothetical protein